MKKQITACLLAVFLAVLPICLSACGKDNNETVYLSVNSKEQADLFEKAAKVYKDETGKTVTVKTGDKAKDLNDDEMKTTVFIIENTEEYEKLKEYCGDLSGSKIGSYLLNEDLALKSEDGKKVYAIPYEITGYGIICNKKILDRYFKSIDGAERITSISEVTDHKSLKKLVEELKDKKSELGITTVFASPSLRSEDAWEWQSGVLNVPLYYEFSANDDYKDPEEAFKNAKEIDLRYDKEYKGVLDLILSDTTDKTLFETKAARDSIAEFAEGKAAMMVASDKIYAEIKSASNEKLGKDDIGFLPLYTDIKNDKNQGITVKRERYLAVNRKADNDSRDAAYEFLSWLFSSKEGKRIVSDDMGILTPFNTFDETELTDDPLRRETRKSLGDNSVEKVLWVISEPIKELTKSTTSLAVGAYMAGKKTFDEAKTEIKERLKTGNR